MRRLSGGRGIWAGGRRCASSTTINSSNSTSRALTSHSQGIISSTARSGSSRRLTSSFTSVKQSNRGRWLPIAVVGAGVAASFGVVWAEDKNKEAPDWRERITGNYKNRIREWSTPEKIFSTFATVKKNGEAYMTIEDFCDAILPYDYRHHDERVKVKHVPDFIRLADFDKDQLISFPEYVFFTLLLGLPEEHFKIAFQMFDLDGSGSIDREEFSKLVNVLQQESPVASKQRAGPPVEDAGIFKLFFGEDGTKQLSYAEFESFLQKVQRGVLQLEFDRYDQAGTGKISPRNFAMAIVGYAHPKRVPEYLERVNSLQNHPGSVSFDEFVAFNKALKTFPEVGLAAKLYSQRGKMDKQAFARAVKTVAGVELSPLQVDVIFHIFDRDGDGNLDYEELVGVMEKRLDRGMAHHRDTGFLRFVNCFKHCCSRKAL